MKNILVSVLLLSVVPFTTPLPIQQSPASLPVKPSGNLFIITIDGFRWQEVFNGADSSLLADEQYTPGAEYMKLLYWSQDPEERRKKLLPFFWNVLAVKGQLYGNREFDNKVNNANPYSLSYPGYNEMLTGITDPQIASNEKRANPNINVLEWLDEQPSFRGRVAAFSSWDVFPYILNAERNSLVINSGYNRQETNQLVQHPLIRKVQDEAVYEKKGTRHDELTFLTAKEYIIKYKPRVVFLGLGETDEFAHDKRYDLYLEQATKSDRMIAGLWHWVQTTPGYKDNTAFIITTDHGRGSKHAKWTSHGGWIKGSSQTWIALIGPGIKALGEVRETQQVYQVQIAQTIAALVGEDFAAHTTVPGLSLQ